MNRGYSWHKSPAWLLGRHLMAGFFLMHSMSNSFSLCTISPTLSFHQFLSDGALSIGLAFIKFSISCQARNSTFLQVWCLFLIHPFFWHGNGFKFLIQFNSKSSWVIHCSSSLYSAGDLLSFNFIANKGQQANAFQIHACEVNKDGPARYSSFSNSFGLTLSGRIARQRFYCQMPCMQISTKCSLHPAMHPRNFLSGLQRGNWPVNIIVIFKRLLQVIPGPFPAKLPAHFNI